MARGHKAMRKYLEEWGFKILHQAGKVILKEVFKTLWGKEEGMESVHGDGRRRKYKARKTFEGSYSSLREAFLQHRDHYVRNIVSEDYPDKVA